MEDEKEQLIEKLKKWETQNDLNASYNLLHDIKHYKNDNKYFHKNSIPSNKIDENSCIYKLKKRLENYINKPTEFSNKKKYKKNKPKVDKADEFYYIDKILKIAGVENKKNDIIERLKNNYDLSLIEDDEYKPDWNDDIKEKYLSKFVLYSLDLSGIFKYFNRNRYNDDIHLLLERLELEVENKEPNKNMVTIFISGFLTANKNSFAQGFKNYSFKANGKSDYYFYSWPSCASPDFDKNIFEIIEESINTLNGIGCNFEEAYNNAIIVGEILSDIIGSQKFFGAKINLVGHSLGCRVIYYCLKYFSQNYKTLTETINDVIFLAGATTINEYELRNIVEKFVGGRFIHCFNKNDSALFISKPFSDSPIGLGEIWNYNSKIENYETDLEHTDYCCNLDKILEKIKEIGNKELKDISFI